jgi:site-specific DNA recombinase
MTVVPAVIYAAKSSPQDNDESTGAQIEQCRERIGREADRVLFGDPFSEENVSAYHGNRGPELEAAIRAAVDAVEQHSQAELWVWKSNRLARGSGRRDEARSLLELFTDLRRQGVTLRSVSDDEYLREEFVGMASRMAHKFAEDLGSDVQRGRRRAFDAGEHGGGPCWDGYRDVPLLGADDKPVVSRRGKVKMRREIDPEREPTMRRLWHLLLDGIADGTVARTLNREGHRTRDGKAWSRRRVQDTRMNPTYAGAVVWHRGKPDEEINWNGLHDGRYLTHEQWEHIQAACAIRDRAADSRASRNDSGRPTRRYVLSKLAVCARCGEPMYASTSPYKRKRDGGKARTYLCKNVHGGTGLCDAPRINAEVVDLAVIRHLDTLFIDFDAWLAELDKSAEQQRAELEAALDSELAKLAKLDTRVERIEADYLRQIDKGDEDTAEFVRRMLERTHTERRRVEEAIAAHHTAITALDEPATDAMLDIYSRLRDSIRGATDDNANGGFGTLNERLRAIFSEFRLDQVDDDAVGILPVLRTDVVERYGSERTTMIGDDRAVTDDEPTSSAAPVALFATGANAVTPPAKTLQASLSQNSGNSQLYLWTKPKRGALAASQPYAEGGPRSSSVPLR